MGPWKRRLEEEREPAACGSMGSFINEAEAQSGKALTEEQSSSLVASGERIEDVIGCR